MADNVSKLAIEISAKGGGAGAEEIQKIINAFKGVSTEHGDLKTKFAEKFEHIGVKTFGHQLLGLAGIHSETRPILGAMSLGVNSVAGAFGVAAGSAGLFTFGLVALVAIVYKVVEAHNKHKDALAEVTKKNDEAIGKNIDLTRSLDEYQKKVGALPKDLKDLKESTEELTKAQLANQIQMVKGQIVAAQEALTLNEKQNSKTKDLITANRDLNSTYQNGAEEHVGMTAAIDIELDRQKKLTEAHLTLKKDLDELVSKQKSLEGGFKDTNDRLKEGTKLFDEHAKLVEKDAAQTLKVADAVQKLADKERSYNVDTLALYADTVGKKEALVKMRSDKELASLKMMYDKEIAEVDKFDRADLQNHEKAAVQKRQIEAAYQAAVSAGRKKGTAEEQMELQKRLGANKTVLGTMQDTAFTAFDSISAKFGAATATMIVDGDKMKENFGQIMKDIVRMFIEAVVEMEIKWLAFMAITGGAGGAGGAFSFFPKARASGGVDVVDRPTMFLAGEAGPERVSFEPIHGFGGNGGGSGSQSSASGGGSIGAVNVTMNVSGASDPKDIAAQVGREIIKTIRGMGQIDFRRTA